MCLSLANPSIPPDESFSFSGGIEIDWRTLTGGQDALYYNLLMIRLLAEGKQVSAETIRQTCVQHVHRGLSYLSSRRDDDLLVDLAKLIQAPTPD